MCTLLVGVDRPSVGRLLLGANRDESATRLATPPQVLHRDPFVIGGRDTRAGGTWLGMRPGGLVAAVLNRVVPGSGGPASSRPGSGGPARPSAAGTAGSNVAGSGGSSVAGATVASSGGFATPKPPPGLRSRGLLCLDALVIPSAPEIAQWLRDEVIRNPYAPFTLFFADFRGAYAAYWDGQLRIDELRPGWHVITHGDADDSFDPRSELAHTLLRQSPPREPEDLAPILQSHIGGRPICHHGEPHGTVSSSLLLVTWRDPTECRYLHASGRPCSEPYEDFSQLATLLLVDPESG